MSGVPFLTCMLAASSFSLDTAAGMDSFGATAAAGKDWPLVGRQCAIVDDFFDFVVL